MKSVRVLLISTYDLGRQPFGLASPAAWLRRAGIEVDCIDTSREPLTDDTIRGAAIAAFYLPMHTATRLAIPLIDRVRALTSSKKRRHLLSTAPEPTRILAEPEIERWREVNDEVGRIGGHMGQAAKAGHPPKAAPNPASKPAPQQGHGSHK